MDPKQIVTPKKKEKKKKKSKVLKKVTINLHDKHPPTSQSSKISPY